MKKLSMLLVAILCLGVALAEPAPSPTANMWDDISNAWGDFISFADEAGRNAINWAEGATKDAAQFINDNLPAINAWLDEAGQFIAQAGNSIGEGVSGLGDEVSKAWAVLRDEVTGAGDYTRQELESAYDTVQQWLKDNNADSSVVEAVDGIAKAAGLKQ